jgi:hypothetical protein
MRKGEMMPDKFESTFDFLRSTKRTFRFQEVGGTNIEILYVKQSAFKVQPKKIKVTVEVLE